MVHMVVRLVVAMFVLIVQQDVIYVLLGLHVPNALLDIFCIIMYVTRVALLILL